MLRQPSAGHRFSVTLFIMLAALSACLSDDTAAPTDGGSTRGGTVIIPETNLRGQVLDAVSGAIVAGAVVEGGGVTATTASDGSYNLQRLQMAVVQLVTTRAGYDTARTLLPLTGRDQIFNVRLRLTPAP